MNGAFKIETSTVANLLNKYGLDFFKKCHYYKTAIQVTENGYGIAKVAYLGLISFDEKTLEFTAYKGGSAKKFQVSVFDLDNFVL